jgi:hypothetical protein
MTDPNDLRNDALRDRDKCRREEAMTEHMTDDRLAELRAAKGTGRLHRWLVDNDDVIGLLARLDAAEELIREVAHCCANPEFYDERVKWSSVQINNDTIAQVRSYLR